MDIIPIIIPIVVSYVVGTYCPFTPGFSKSNRVETKGEKIIRKNVWPVLAGTIGFAWYFARNKAAAVQLTSAAKKGTRKAIGKLSKWFQGSHKYTLDFAFLLLIGMLNWWIWLYSCERNKQHAFYALAGSLAVIFWVIYLTASYTSSSLLLLTPLLIWLLFSVQRAGAEIYYSSFLEDPVVAEEKEETITEANKKLNNEKKELKEQFRIW